jgi:hypothetical protein
MRHDAHYVEALTSSAGTPIGRMIPIERIDPNPDQPRQVMGDLSELMASIAEKGIIEPEIAAAYFEKQHPPAAPVMPNSMSAFDYLNQPAEGGDEFIYGARNNNAEGIKFTAHSGEIVLKLLNDSRIVKMEKDVSKAIRLGISDPAPEVTVPLDVRKLNFAGLGREQVEQMLSEHAATVPPPADRWREIDFGAYDQRRIQDVHVDLGAM